ncbi:MAG TPA: bacillithiol biosynthesis cysteine-adding enzyme BshC [Bryobacteraceae bacterium]|nr:bacillithiol biosynthesis cysteine-adding enzyme BshC [Bryobacteraceae bacterium]
MQCTCVRQADLPNASKLFIDLIYHYDRVADLYAFPTNDIEAIRRAASFAFPSDRRAASVEAIRPLNPGNPSLHRLAEPGTVAIITGQQVGLFSGPVYTIYKALTAIRIAAELSATGTPAVPMFWLATEDHDFAEVDHAFAFGPDHQPVRLNLEADGGNAPRPVGQRTILRAPLDELRAALGDLPCAEEAVALAARSYQPGETLGSAFTKLLRELFAPYGLLFIDPMLPALRSVAAPFMRSAVEQMPDLTRGIIARSADLVRRGYHAQVLVDDHTSLVFKLRNGERLALRRTRDGFADHAATGAARWSVAELAAHPEELSPNALLRPVAQDYMFPTAAYVGGAAELAYLAQSAILYDNLLGRRPVIFPRAGFTVVDERAAKRMAKYRLAITDLFQPERDLRELISTRLIPNELRHRLDATKSTVAQALDTLDADLRRFDVSQSKALATSRRKIEHQVAKITRKTGLQILQKDQQATHHAASLSGLAFPDGHLQERVYSILPMLARFGPNFISDIYNHVRVECPDHQFAVA